VLALGSLDPAPALAYALAIHMLNITALSGLGVLGLLVEGQSLGSIMAAAKSGGPSTPRSPSPSVRWEKGMGDEGEGKG
jgi:hypothetical protein